MPEIEEGQENCCPMLPWDNWYGFSSVPLRKINKNPVYPANKTFRIWVLPARLKASVRTKRSGSGSTTRERCSNLVHWTQMLCIASHLVRVRCTENWLSGEGGVFRVSIITESIIHLLPENPRISQQSRLRIVQAESRWGDEQRLSSNPSGVLCMWSARNERRQMKCIDSQKPLCPRNQMPYLIFNTK